MGIRFAATGACLTMTIALTGVGTGAQASPVRTEERKAPSALTCPAGYFCAYSEPNYRVQILKSRAGRGSEVDVADGKTRSGSNNTANEWVGVNYHCCGVPDDDVNKWAPYTEMNNNSTKIDYFSVR